MRMIFCALGAWLVMSLGVIGAVDENGLDPEVLIHRILTVDSAQRAEVRDVTFDAVYVEREDKGDDGFEEKVRLVKKVYVRFDQDTTLFHEKFLEFYKDGELKSQKDLEKEARERRENKEKRKGRDISYPMLRPFEPNMSDLYTVTYHGIKDDIEGCGPCHHFQVRANEEVDTLINGDYYFEGATFHLARVDFSPAKLVKKAMFKLKELRLSVIYGPVADDVWLPLRFDAAGSGKAALFFGVNFAGTEYYRNPMINTGLDDSLFVGDTDE